jgi:hypothetical protein
MENNKEIIDRIWDLLAQSNKGLESLLPHLPPQQFSAESDILIFLWQFYHEETLKAVGTQIKGREFLFEYYMTLGDALNPNKETVENIYAEIFKSPALILAMKKYALNWARQIGEQSDFEIQNSLIPSPFQNILILGGSLWIFHQWLKDTTLDQSITMVAIDNALDKWEQISQGSLMSIFGP